MRKAILQLAIPNILSNISVPLLGMVDLALMGHLDSEIYVNAIAIGGVLFSFIYISFGDINPVFSLFVPAACRNIAFVFMWNQFMSTFTKGLVFVLIRFK